MTARKPIYRDSHGRFVSLPPEARAKLEAMRTPTLTNVVEVKADMVRVIRDRLEREFSGPYCDEIYRPQRKGWLERALHWFTWTRSRA
jgi:hypothetical protein